MTTSHTRMPRRRLHLVVAAVIGGLLATMGAGSTAEAATLSPQLVALTVSPTSVTPPGEVVVHYTATAEASKLGYVSMLFVSPAGSKGNVTLSQAQAPLDGTLRWSIPDGLRNATYELSSVTVMSTDGTAGTTYRRDGTTSRGGTHAFDFPGKDVTVSGSHEDFAGPVLASVTVSTPAVKPGQPVTITWTGQEAHSWKSAQFTFVAADGGSGMELSTTDAAELAARKITRPAPASLYNTKHTLSSVWLEDNLGNTTLYDADGRLLSTPYDGPTQTATHTLPFASWAFTVSGSTYDARPPKLVSIAVDKNTIRTDDSIKVSYVTQDDTAPLEQVVVRYTRPDSMWKVDLGGSNLPLAGSFTTSLSEGGYPGRLTFHSVEVRDRRGYVAYYWPDGTIRNSSDDITARHTLDLSHLDLSVLPRQVSAWARARPQSAQVSWSVGPSEARGLTGYQVTVNPGGRVISVPKSSKPDSSIIVSGLTNAVKYTFTVKSLSAVGSSPAASATATPLISGNVWSAGDVNGDRINDLFAALPTGVERLYRGKGGATFSGGTTVSSYGTSYRKFPGDKLFGLASFYAVSTWDNGMEGVLVERDGTSSGGVIMGKGWGMRFLDGSADFTGDKRADLVGVTETGNAFLYRSTTTVATFTKGTQIASGWGSMQKIFAATDVTGDGKADLLGVDKAGVLWIFPGTGRGTFYAKRMVSSGWGGLGGLFYARDLNGDGKGDLGAVTMGGTLRVYKGRGNGTFTGATSISTGWAPYL